MGASRRLTVGGRGQLRTWLLGDVILGPWYPAGSPQVDVVLSGADGGTLIYGEGVYNGLTHYIGGYDPKPLRRRFEPFHQGGLNPRPGRPLRSNMEEGPYSSCFSAVPLELVEAVTVYSDHATHLCRGLVFEYRNSSHAAAGDVRIGVDRAERYEWPKTICLSAELVRRPSPSHRPVKGHMVTFHHRGSKNHIQSHAGWPGGPWTVKRLHHGGILFFESNDIMSMIEIISRPQLLEPPRREHGPLSLLHAPHHAHAPKGPRIRGLGVDRRRKILR